MTDINISDFSFPSPVMTIKKVIYLRPRQPVLFVFWHWQEGGEGGVVKKSDAVDSASKIPSWKSRLKAASLMKRNEAILEERVAAREAGLLSCW